MASVQNLEVVVDIDISQALAALTELQDELRELATQIEEVDAIGSEGVSVRTNLEELDAELAEVAAEIEAFEEGQTLDIDVDVRDSQLSRIPASRTLRVRTSLENIDDELSALATKIEAFEQSNRLTIPVDIDDDGQFGGIMSNRRAGQLRGVMRDAMTDAMTSGDFTIANADINVANADIRGASGAATRTAAAAAAGTGGGGGFGLPSNVGPLMGQFLDLEGDTDGRTRLWRRFARSMRESVGSLRKFDIRMSDLHNLMASLIPLLLTFIGAIPAAVTALVTLAGAALAAGASLLAIAGFGALGAAATGGEMPAMEDFTEFIEEIRDSFFEAFMPLAERLEPVFRDAMAGLDVFFTEIARQGDALMALTDEARDFGRWATEFIPAVLRNLAGLVEAMDPVFGMIADFARDNQIIRGFVEATLQALPALAALTDALITALPAIVRLSIGFTKTAVAATKLLGFIWELFTAFGLFSEEAIGAAIGSLLVLLSVLALTIKTVSFFSGTAVARAISAVIAWVPANLLAAESFGALSLAAQIATVSVIAFLSVITLGAIFALSGAVVGLGDGFLSLSDDIDMATKSLRDFDRVASRTDSFNPYGGSGAPPSGAASRGGGAAAPNAGGNDVTVNLGDRGDKEKNNSDAKTAAWLMGRTSGAGPPGRR